MECDLRLPVEQIGWSQDSIASTSKGRNEDLRDTHLSFRSLTNDERLAIVNTYPPIRVVSVETQGWITLDNPRLFLFRTILNPGTLIPVRVATYQESQELQTKLTSPDSDATLVVRANQSR
jgi:hypothetical protein